MIHLISRGNLDCLMVFSRQQGLRVGDRCGGMTKAGTYGCCRIGMTACCFVAMAKLYMRACLEPESHE